MHQHARPDNESDSGVERLDSPMADVVRGTGASVGLLFLLPPDEGVLWLALVSGASLRLAAPWARVSMHTSTPVADAIHERRLVWLASQEEMARRYPQLGIVLPYDFMLAAAPLTTGTQVWGGVALLWPMWHSATLTQQERESVGTFCRLAADLLKQAADHGRPLLPPVEPRLLPAPQRQADPDHAMAALRFTERLPVGCCALDLSGRLTFINPAGADLVGAGAASLVGNRPWEVLLWLHDPGFRRVLPVGSDHPPSHLVHRRAPPGHTAVLPALPQRQRHQRPHHTPRAAGSHSTAEDSTIR